MKKTIPMILAAAAMFALTACGGGSTASTSTPVANPPTASNTSLAITSATVTTTPATPIGTLPLFATGDSITVAWTVDFVSPTDFYSIDVRLGKDISLYNNPLLVKSVYTTSGGTQGGAIPGKSGSVVISRPLDRSFTSPLGTIVFGDIANNIPYPIDGIKFIYIEARTSDIDPATGLQRKIITVIPVFFTPNGL